MTVVNKGQRVNCLYLFLNNKNNINIDPQAHIKLMVEFINLSLEDCKSLSSVLKNTKLNKAKIINTMFRVIYLVCDVNIKLFLKMIFKEIS